MAIETVTTKSINWGGVLKGAAIVTAVVVAAVVAAAVLPDVIIWAQGLITDPTTQTLLGNAWDGLKSIGETLWGWAESGGNTVAGWWNDIPRDWGLKNTFSVANPDTLKSTVGPVAGLVVGGAAVAASVPAFNHIDFTTHHATLGSHHGVHDLAHTAGESAQHSKSHAQRFSARETYSRGFADRVRASQADKPTITPRDANFAKQLTTDREKLGEQLGEKII